MIKIVEAYWIIKKSGIFDAKYYYKMYPDVRRADVNPLLHFVLHGWKEGRNPSETFVTSYYLDSYEDVKNSGMNPLVHYLKYGIIENRKTRNDSNNEIKKIPQLNSLQKKESVVVKNFHSYKSDTNQFNIRFQSSLYARIKNKTRDIVRKTVNRIPNKRIREFLLLTGRKFSAKTVTPLGQKSITGSTKDQIHKVIYDYLLTNSQESKKDFVPYSNQFTSISDFNVKLIAFYLPQFHPIPENDRWWGKGFTEWTNVSKAIPQFVGHYQPHLPGDLGFYDLRVKENQKLQVELAKNYGLYGFCYYYYWFNGKRLLEKPLDNHADNPNIDFPFCICWANENWTRRWDGQEQDILISQNYSDENDLKLIQDLCRYFSNEKYIHIESRPVLIIYRPQLLPDPAKTTSFWRNYCIQNGFGDPFLIAAESFGNSGDPRSMGFDASLEFPPHYLGKAQIDKRNIQFANSKFSGNIYDYEIAMRTMTSKIKPDYMLFKTLMTAWDNTARKQNNANIFINTNPKNYQQWLEKNIEYTIKNHDINKRLVFINAWNEWAEGAHLEPDKKFGYAYLQATATALKKFIKKPINSNWTILFVGHDAHLAGAQLSLLSIIKWFQENTAVKVKVLLLEKGQLLNSYQEIADVLLYEEISNLSDVEKLNSIISFCETKPNLIYLNTVVSGKVIRILNNLKITILTHIRELESSILRYGKEWINDVFSFSSYYIACSEYVRTFLINTYNIPEKKCFLTYSFIETNKNCSLLNSEEKIAVRSNLGLDQNKTLIFGCGVGMPFRKGADLFIDVARKLLDKDINDFHLYWVGDLAKNEVDPKYGKWKDHLDKMQKNGLDKWVTFIASNENPRDFFLAGDIFALTSREEPLGRVMLEAGDCGLPTICFEGSGGPAEFVRNDAGYIVKAEDTAAMAEKIIFLKENELIRRSLGEKARTRVKEEFSAAAVAPKIFSICRNITNQKPFISIIVPNFNHAKYLEARLESIYKQTFQDFEVIILDDASTDNSMEIIESYRQHLNTTIIANMENSNAPFKQWQKGLHLAQSSIIWLAESDDICDPSFLETLLPAFNDPDVKLAYSASKIIDDDGVIKGTYKDADYLTSLSETKWQSNYCVIAEQEINDGLGIKNTILNMSSVIFRKVNFDADFEKTILQMRTGFDTYFILNQVKNGKIYYESQPLNYHRRHSKSIVGRLLSNKKDDDIVVFFQNLAINYSYVLHNFHIYQNYQKMFENYISELTHHFGIKNESELNRIFPLKTLRTEIETNINN